MQHDTALPDPEFHAELYADVPAKRLIAWIIDSIVTVALTALIVLLSAFTALFILPLAFLTVAFLYRTVTIARDGATPGMRMMAISLRNASGASPTPVEAALHTTVFLAASAMVLPQILSIAMILMTPHRQSLGDMLLGTAMINRAARM
jgi:uncharacterized RDD family membrane protein YckC